jgi:hypothetical protein
MARLRMRPQRGAADAPITTEAIRELLDRRVLNSYFVMPGDAELTKLAGICEGWRLRCAAEREIRDTIDAKQKAARKAAEAWRAALADLSAGLMAFVPKADPAGKHHLLLLAGSVHRDILKAAAAAEAAEADYLAPIGYGWTDWAPYADALAEDFRRALRPKNPIEGLENAVTRFLAALAPLMTGETPTPGSVDTKLKTMRRSAR